MRSLLNSAARRFVHGQKVFTRAGRDQMGDGPNYRGALLADIQLRQVEAEDLGLADKIPQFSFGDSHPAVLQQTVADRKQVVEELGHKNKRKERMVAAGLTSSALTSTGACAGRPRSGRPPL